MISVIMPVYNEGNQIYNNVIRVHSILDASNIKHQFILVNDGSTDNTWSELTRLSNYLDIVSIINLSRNFGKERALCAALEHSSGDAFLVIDSDLQHPPELIPEMVRLWSEEDYDVVEGIKSSRGNESLSGKLAALSFYRIFNKVSEINLNSASDFKLIDKKVIDAWKELKESIPFFRGMSAWVGFRRIQIPFEVQDRIVGESKWSFKSLINLAVQSITSYTSAPLYIVTWLGLVMFFIDLILIIQTLFMKFSGNASTGFTTVIIIILGIGSCIMISLGIIGLYIARIYEEVKHRPRYLISTKKGNGFINE